jgi:predicted nucleotidyltransferase
VDFKVVQSLFSRDGSRSQEMEVILKSLTNVVTISRKGKEKDDSILNKNKRISPTHIRDKQVVDVDLDKDDDA